MSQIEQRLAEIEARHKAANESDDMMAWTEFEERAYTDIPRLVAALRVAVDALICIAEREDPTCFSCGRSGERSDDAIGRIKAALKGDAA